MSIQLRPMLVLAGIILGAVSADFNSQVAANAMGDVAGGLGFGHDSGTWFNSLYVSAEVLGMALSPWLLVTFTLRQFTLYVFLLNAVSSALIPFSPDIPALYMLRSLQGLSGGFTIPLLLTTALRVLEPSIKLYGLAAYALTATFTPALATSVAALWTDLVGWRFVFLESIPLCVVSALFIWFGEEQDAPDYSRFAKFDWRGALGVLVGFGALTTMLEQGNRYDWFDSPFICVLALVSVVTIPLLLLNEWFHELPLLKLQLFGRPNLLYGGIALISFLLIGQAASTIPNEFLRDVGGLRPEQFYTVTLVVALLQLVLLPATAWLLDHRSVDARWVNAAGLVIVFVACVGASGVTPVWLPQQFYLWQVLQGIGQPLVVVPLLLLATGAIESPEEAPFASALVNTPRAVAEAVGVWLVQLIGRWRGDLHYDRLADQAGRDRWRLIQAPPLPGHPPPPLLPDGHQSAPGSLAGFAHQVEAQARTLTAGDAYLVFAAITLALLLVLVVLPRYVLPPRIAAEQKA